MRRPVTVASGRVYDGDALRAHREAERGNGRQHACPVTRRPAPPDAVREGTGREVPSLDYMSVSPGSVIVNEACRPSCSSSSAAVPQDRPNVVLRQAIDRAVYLAIEGSGASGAEKAAMQGMWHREL